MKPGEMMTITRDEGETYTIILGNRSGTQLGPDEALATVAQALFGDKGSTPHFLWTAERRIAFEKELARPREDTKDEI